MTATAPRERGLEPEQLAPARLQRISGNAAWLLATAGMLLLFLVLPLVVILASAVLSGTFFDQLARPVVREALKLSLWTTLVSLACTLALGTPAAYLLARYEFAGKRVVDTLIDLPMVLPPAVAGLALLVLFGRSGPLGSILATLGISLPFTSTAVILAQLFVASPFYVRTARSGFEAVDTRLEQVAATLGVPAWRIFLHVTLPLALPALAAGAVMAWARALGEFGATIMFAGNLVGVTQTLPLALYVALQDDVATSLALGALMLVLSFTVLIVFRLLARRQLEARLHA